MTFVGPYTESTLIYEPSSLVFLGVKSNPLGILDFVTHNAHGYCALIKKAKMENFYNNPDLNYTLFISEIPDNILKNISVDLAQKILKMSTLDGLVTTKMLSNEMILNPINTYEKLYVRVFETHKINNYCQNTCKFSKSDSGCNMSNISCNLNKYQTQPPQTCESLNNRLIQINNTTLVKGDILVNGGIIHILQKPLWPMI